MTLQDQPSANTPGRSRMTLVAERHVPDDPSPSHPQTGSSTPNTATTTNQTTLQNEYIHRAAWKAGVLGTLNVISAVLAVRLILLVSVSGAVALAYLALHEPDPYRLGALAVYGVLVVLPLVWLAARR